MQTFGPNEAHVPSVSDMKTRVVAPERGYRNNQTYDADDGACNGYGESNGVHPGILGSSRAGKAAFNLL